MLQKHISLSTLYYNSAKYNTGWTLTDYINSWADEALVTKLESLIPEWCIIVLWWDGTLLKVIKEVHTQNRPILWVNFGTKWFLLHSIHAIDMSTDFHIQQYPLLECAVSYWDTHMKSIAFNEIDLRANTGKIIELDISISGKNNAQSLSTNLKWDGFVFSTPAGSTGYNFSLGWPIIPHELKTFVLTPKAPWLPRYFKSVLINDSKTVTIKNTWRLSDIKIICDGTDFVEVKDKEITVTIKKSALSADLLIPNNSAIAWEDTIFLEQNFG